MRKKYNYRPNTSVKMILFEDYKKIYTIIIIILFLCIEYTHSYAAIMNYKNQCSFIYSLCDAHKIMHRFLIKSFSLYLKNINFTIITIIIYRLKQNIQ